MDRTFETCPDLTALERAAHAWAIAIHGRLPTEMSVSAARRYLAHGWGLPTSRERAEVAVGAGSWVFARSRAISVAYTMAAPWPTRRTPSRASTRGRGSTCPARLAHPAHVAGLRPAGTPAATTRRMPTRSVSPSLIQPDATTPADEARLEAYAAAMAGAPEGDVLDAEHDAHEASWAKIDAERERLAVETEAIECQAMVEHSATGTISEVTLAAYEANQRAWQAMAGRRPTTP